MRIGAHRFDEQGVACRFHHVDQRLVEGMGGKPRLDCRQDADLEMAGKAQEFPARPEQAGMHDDRHHRHLQVAVDAAMPNL